MIAQHHPLSLRSARSRREQLHRFDDPPVGGKADPLVNTIIPALAANLPLLKSAALVGVDIRHFLASRPREAQAARAALFAQVASGALAAPRIVSFGLAQASRALAAISLRNKVGKVVILPGEQTVQ